VDPVETRTAPECGHDVLRRPPWRREGQVEVGSSTAWTRLSCEGGTVGPRLLIDVEPSRETHRATYPCRKPTLKGPQPHTDHGPRPRVRGACGRDPVFGVRCCGRSPRTAFFPHPPAVSRGRKGGGGVVGVGVLDADAYLCAASGTGWGGARMHVNMRSRTAGPGGPDPGPPRTQRTGGN
jgi:hypothetical protein